MIFTCPPPHLGQRCMSMSNTRFNSRAQPMRCGRARTGSTSSHSARASTSVAAGPGAGGPCGTTRARSFALGASTPWYRIRCSLGRGTSYRSLDADNPQIQIKHRGKKTRLTELEVKTLKRRQAIEPVIGHLKADHRMGRCHLKGALGDKLHAVLCAAGYNVRWLLRMIAKEKACGPCCVRFAPWRR